MAVETKVTLAQAPQTSVGVTLSSGREVRSIVRSRGEVSLVQVSQGVGVQVSRSTPEVKVPTVRKVVVNTQSIGGVTLNVRMGGRGRDDEATMDQSTIKGRAAGAGSGLPIDLTADEVSEILDSAVDPFLRTSGLPIGSVVNYVNFNGGLSAPLACTYSRTGTTVTVTSVAHGHIVGHVVVIDFTGGGALDGIYTITATPTPDTYTITTVASGTIAAGSTMNEDRASIRGSNGVHSVMRVGAGVYYVNFSVAFADANYSGVPVVGSTGSVRIASIGHFAAPTAQSFQFSTFTDAGASVDATYCHCLFGR